MFMQSSRHAKPPDCGSRQAPVRSLETKRCAHHILGTGTLATAFWIQPPKPRRNQHLGGHCCAIPCQAVDALSGTVGPSAHGTKLRLLSRKSPNSHRRAQPLDSSLPTPHRGRRANPSGEGETALVSCFVQQCPVRGPATYQPAPMHIY
jgi:hypothetical protein